MKIIRKISTDEPLTLQEVKTFLRVDHDLDDGLISLAIQAARETAEDETNRALVQKELSLTVDKPGISFEIPRPPFVSMTTITGAITVRIDDATEPAKVYFEQDPLQVTLQFVCGYATAADVPAKIKQAMLLMLAHWYDNRAIIAAPGAQPLEMPFAASQLLAGCRVVPV